MIPDDQFLLRALHDQFAMNLGVNLLNDELAEHVSVSPLFLHAAEQLRSAEFTSPVDEHALSQIAAEECIVRLLHVNPYLEIADTDVAALTAIYESSCAMIRSGEPTVRVIGEHHFKALQAWIAALYPQRLREALRDSSSVGTLAYSQYSAELQLRMLHIEPEAIGGQVLDFAYPPRTYDLILSHLAFSSHYLYHISTASEFARRYRTAYDSIVEALTVDGRFCYVPSLPDIESSLPNELFKVSRWAISPGVSVSTVTRDGSGRDVRCCEGPRRG